MVGNMIPASCSFVHRQLPSGIIFNSSLLELSAGPEEAWKVHLQKPGSSLSCLCKPDGTGDTVSQVLDLDSFTKRLLETLARTIMRRKSDMGRRREVGSGE